ncbi:xanthine dehydrogenase family protein molybdopterin-binding subunit [Amycolatopsis sp. GM8]|uniref:xanthine dehydrogenase family protein molybdopterin-binding subunit n=1 Tax=Amycolatopsis sp. GM8 TaxID=2896530 RepID=UPI001F28B677|nr:xanthine dehydrogenase family protein molybdopterin-binding subunit [Amycolatopsis sp. GM8]
MSGTTQPWPKTDGFAYAGGTASFVDDLRPDGLLHMAVARSTRAHARLAKVNTAEAERVAGVVRVLDGREASTHLKPIPYAMGDPELIGARRGHPFAVAVDQVHYPGEPIAVVVAESPRAARAGAAAVSGDYRDLPDDEPEVLAENHFRAGDPEAAFASAPHELEVTFPIARSTGAPLEPRGYLASWDEDTHKLTVHASHQQPFALRATLAEVLGMPETAIRVVVPPVGGAFGIKMAGQPEEPLVCLMSLLCRRPVKWIETRAETMLGGAREQVHHVRAGFDADGQVVVFRDDITIPVGAEGATPGWRQAYVTAATLPTAYAVPNVEIRSRVLATHQPPWQSCRGYGKETAVLVMERTMDLVARHVGLDPAEVRRRNLLTTESLPHRMPSGYLVDSGDFPALLTKVLHAADYEQQRASIVSPSEDGLLHGLGIAVEVTPEGGGHASGPLNGRQPTAAVPEAATVRIEPDGRVVVLSSVTNPGGGNETSLARLAAAELGVDRGRVTVIQGDTDLCPPGTGNASSRGTAVGGAAVVLAARDLAQKLRETEGAERTEALSCTRTYRPETLRSPQETVAYRHSYPYFSSGAYVARVSVDPATGVVRVLGLTAVHDCGRVIDEVLVEGQLQGAIAMGIGLAVSESSQFGADGALRTSSFKEYLIPRANDLPSFTIEHHETPAPGTLLGAKGAGEAGVGGAMAAVANAVDDALAGQGAAVTTVPLTPPTVLDLLETRGRQP